MLRDLPILDAALRLALALLLALPLGCTRERQSRSAGVRTYALLSAGSCGFLLVAQRSPGGTMDQANVFFGVLGGIAFVASGAIVKSREPAAGTSTAVNLWVAGAVGAGVAYGASFISAAVALLSALTLWAPSPVKPRAS
jgi:putative Mg2+ transporter-C (MgtC) family protein